MPHLDRSVYGPLPFDARKRVFYACGESIQAVDLVTGRKRPVLSPPACPYPLPPRRRDDDEWEEERDRSPSFLWLLELSPDGRELCALLRYDVPKFHLVLADVKTGAATSRPLTNYGGYLAVNFASRRFFQGHHDDGPVVTTLEGGRIAALPALKHVQRDGAFSVGGERLILWDRAMAQERTPFALWSPSTGEYRVLRDFGSHATWTFDGSGFWFMKGNHELWRHHLASGTSEPFLQVQGMAWDRGCTGGGSFQCPVVSSDGRYLFVQLTDATHGLSHTACVLDLKDRRVRQVPTRWHENVTWLD